MKHCWTILIPLLTAGRLDSQTLFEGNPGQPGDVVTLGFTDQRPAELQDIELLPLDCVGRTASTSLLTDRAQRIDDIPGASRLLLPGNKGSLYRYRRSDYGETRFGLFRVDATQARAVFERDGWGPADAGDPFLGKIAVSSDGSAVLIASVREAGGDLWEVDLIQNSVVRRTGSVAPRSFASNGLALLTSWGFALAAEGPQRFQRTPGARVEGLVMPSPCNWYGGDVVFSQDESTVAFVAGESPDRAHVYVCRRFGPVERVTTTPDRVVGAGFLPEEQHGPTLAVSTDGSRVAWMTRNDYSRECWVAQLQTAPIQVTSDERFDDTLNDAGVISFFDPDSMIVLVGEGIEVGEGDLYRIDLDPGLGVSNLTGTSGIVLPPHDYGTIVGSDGVYRLPGDAGWLVLDSRDNDDTAGNLPGRLLRVDQDGGVRTLLENVEVLERVERAGGYVAAIVERTSGADFPGLSSQNVVQVSIVGSALERLVVPMGTRIARVAGSRVRNRLGVVAVQGAGEWLGQIQLPSRSGLVVSSQFLRFGPTLSQDSAGSVYTTLVTASVNAFFAWTDLGVVALRQSPGFILPGE